MGRTVPTFTMVLQQEMQSWSKFRRGLRREDQEAFDDLFRAARLQLAGSAYAARPIPFESIAVAILVMQHRRILGLERAVRLLEERLHTVAGPPGGVGREGKEGSDDGDGPVSQDHRVVV